MYMRYYYSCCWYCLLTFYLFISIFLFLLLDSCLLAHSPLTLTLTHTLTLTQMAEEISEVRLLQREVKKYQLDQELSKDKAAKRAKREAAEYKRLSRERTLQNEAKKLKSIREREEAENTAREYKAQMTARETEKRKQMREYRAQLDAQVDRKHAGDSSRTHLSPTERSLNRRMLAKMARMDLTASGGDTGSQWSGSQYSMSYGCVGNNNSPGSIRTSRLGGTNGVGGAMPGAAVSGGRISPVDPGWRGASGSRYQKTSTVSRQEILDLLDSDMMMAQ